MKAHEKTNLVPCEMLISGYRGLRKGEIAGFPEAVAKNLVEKKAAKAIDPAPARKETPARETTKAS